MAFDDSRPALLCAAHGVRPNCSVCPARGACLVGGASRADTEAWNAALLPQVPLAGAGRTLFETGASAEWLYVVRAGCLKAFTVDSEGEERVRGFFFPGDIIGLDSLGASRMQYTVASVTPAQLCRVPRTQALQILARTPELARRLLERTSLGFAQAQALAGDFTAEERVAAFLMLMRDRLGGSTLRLPMTRRDIANYLRLATETVCRVLTRFEKQGWIALDARSIRLGAEPQLGRVAAPVGFGASQLAA